MISSTTRVGDRATVRCANTGKTISGTVIWAGPSSTPHCWRIDVRPDPGTHPVSPVIVAWDTRRSGNSPGCRQCAANLPGEWCPEGREPTYPNCMYFIPLATA